MSTNIIPMKWCQGLISPFFKSEDKLNPENYRPICVTSCLSKLFCLILNERLTTFLHKYNIIDPCQIGFQAKSRTSEHIFSLKTLINKYVHNTPKGKIYDCFVDFKNVHDSVWQEGLFRKLECLNRDGPFLNVLKDMYSKNSYAIKIGNKRTRFFRCWKGVRQGCPLSPNLFNIYINDIVERLNKANTTPLLLKKNIADSCLLYADDIVIMSLSEDGLQKCLDGLAHFTKTKCITFQKNNKVNKKSQFYIYNKPVSNVSEFTYLGINITANGNFTPTLTNLSSKGIKAIFASSSKFKLKPLPQKAAFKLFDSTIMPILTYGSEVWEYS